MQFIFLTILGFLIFWAASNAPSSPITIENPRQHIEIEETVQEIVPEEAPATTKAPQEKQEKLLAKEKGEGKEKPKSEPPASPQMKHSDTSYIPPTDAPPISKSPPKIVYLSENELNGLTRKIVVNIFCFSKTGGVSAPASGSGVIIDPRGIILTNAHVAQYFLLKDYRIKNFIECSIRAGSPAVPSYTAKLIFISPEWITDHALDLASQNTRGNGEKDYALLLITGTTDARQTLPAVFPAVRLLADSSAIEIGTPVFVASYPAGFIDGITTARDLWLSTSSSRVTNLFSFAVKPPKPLDLFAVAGTIGTQQGSSGGGMFEFREGRLAGLISARTEGATTAERRLYGITSSYISIDMKRQTGSTLEEFLNHDMAERERMFEEEFAPSLRQTLVDALER